MSPLFADQQGANAPRSPALAFLLLFALQAPAAAAEPPTFVVHTAAGQRPAGQLTGIGDDWTVRLRGKADVTVAGGDVLSVRRADAALPPFPDDLHLVLNNGDRLPIEAPRLQGERLRFRHPDLAEGREAGVPVGAVALLWREAPAGCDDAERLRHELLTQTRARDLLILTNGDRIEGTLSGLDGKKVELEVGPRKTAYDLSQIAALALSTELAETLRPRDAYAQATLFDKKGGPGTRVSLAAAAVEGGTFTATTLFGAALQVPLERLAALDLYQGRAVYLSDLKPGHYEFLPYLDERWPLAVDASVAGKDLRLGASTYARGLGMHSRSRVTYALAGGYRRFEALVGLDPRTGREGEARVRVLADGKALELPGKGELTGGGAPLPLGLDVSGVKELTLEVDYGRRGPVQGHVNWVDARLVK